MLRDKRKRKTFLIEEEVSPMEGAINIVDAMLVFACGLMLSLVIYWNVDIKHTELKPNGGEKIEITKNAGAKDVDENKKYKLSGKVYVDPETGEMFYVAD